MEWIAVGLLVLWIIGKLGAGQKQGSQRRKTEARKVARPVRPTATVTKKAESQKPAHKGKKEWDVEQWESELTTVWAGDPMMVTFTYHGHRRKVQVREVLHHPGGRMYILGHCSFRNEDRYFDLAKLETMILMKSKRYDAYDWLVRVLGEELLFSLEVEL